MKDRFKFRVWDKENFNILEFEGFKTGDIEFNFDVETKSIWIEYDHNRYVLQQCTGLRDKNGNLIYEGDIVKILFCEFVIQYCDKCKSFQCFYNNECYACLGDLHWFELLEDLENCEVLGNIYENPELLEV